MTGDSQTQETERPFPVGIEHTGGDFAVHFRGEQLEPTPLFAEFLSKLPEDTRTDNTIRKFGLLTEQLLPVDRDLRIDKSCEPITNDAFEVEIAWRVELVASDITKIEKSALGEAECHILNQTTYSAETRQAVTWFLFELDDEFAARRNEAIAQFCSKTGLVDSDRDTTKSKPSGRSDRRDTVDLPHVGQL